MSVEKYDCSHDKWDLVRNRWANGDVVYWRQCRFCGRNAEAGGKWMTHLEAQQWAARFELELSDLPIIDDHAMRVPPCVVCGARGVELHHWAPREYFGAESEVWPTAWLCRKHHQLWHQRMREARESTLVAYAAEDPGRPF